MLVRLSILLFLFVSLASCAHTGTKSLDPDVPPHLADAQLLLTQLRPEDNVYQPSPSNVSFANTRHDNAECRTDASGFVTAILQHTYRLSDHQLRVRLGNERPLAHHLVTAIEAGPSFTNILHIQDAKPGDIIAIYYASYNRNAGHAMILAAPPRPRTPTPLLIKNYEQWDLDVIDMAESPHSNDTRFQPGEDPHPGAGRGTFRLYTDHEGLVTGYAWDDSPNSGFYPQVERHLVIGRYKP